MEEDTYSAPSKNVNIDYVNEIKLTLDGIEDHKPKPLPMDNSEIGQDFATPASEEDN